LGLSIAGHALEQVSAKIGDQNIAVLCKGQAVGQSAFGKARLFVICVGKHRTFGIGHEFLRAVGRDANHATAGIGAPQGAVALGEDAFWALKILADIFDFGGIDVKSGQRI